jgi:hypothetical protein
MHDFSLDGKAKKIAATWDELGLEQLRRLMPILYGAYADARQQRLEALAVVLGVSTPLLLRFTPVQLLEIDWLVDFLFAEQLDFTKQLLPSVRATWGLRTLYGPADGLANLSFLEFVYADSYFIAYAQRQDTQWLHHLLATLYRPQRRPYRPHAADYAGDRRQNFNPALIDERLSLVARLPQAEQLAILTWYRGCRRALEHRYAAVFTPENEQKASESTDGWAYVLREMSGQAFGSYEETGRQKAAQILAKMEDDTRLAQRQKQQAERQKNSY